MFNNFFRCRARAKARRRSAQIAMNTPTMPSRPAASPADFRETFAGELSQIEPIYNRRKSAIPAQKTFQALPKAS